MISHFFRKARDELIRNSVIISILFMTNTFFWGALIQYIITTETRRGFAYETIEMAAPAAATGPSLLLISIMLLLLTSWFILITLNKLKRILSDQEIKDI